MSRKPVGLDANKTSLSGITFTSGSGGLICTDHRRVGCEHTWGCPNCGSGQTTIPDPCWDKEARPWSS